jgi:hypothetical protein
VRGEVEQRYAAHHWFRDEDGSKVTEERAKEKHRLQGYSCYEKKIKKLEDYKI